jgi:hypothetical protein
MLSIVGEKLLDGFKRTRLESGSPTDVPKPTISAFATFVLGSKCRVAVKAAQHKDSQWSVLLTRTGEWMKVIMSHSM